MRVKLKTALSGPKYSLSVGDEYDFSDYEGERLVEAGFAERVETAEELAQRQEADAAAAKIAHEAKIAADAAAAKADDDAKAAAEAEAAAQTKSEADGAAVTAPADAKVAPAPKKPAKKA